MGALKKLALVLGALALLIAVLCARMLLGARAEVRAASDSSTRNEGEAQIRHLRRAMAYYLPGNPWVRQARDLLLEEARQAEARGERSRALDALHQLRSAILSLRGITHPYAETLPEVNRRLAELMVRDPQASRDLRVPEGRERLLQRLDHPPEPHPLWAGLGLFGFLSWVGGALALFWRGLRPDASLVPRTFWPLAGVVALGLLLFCLGLARA
jgi:hypothetical protein